MGALKDEVAGNVKKEAGKLVGNEDLQHKGEDQIEEGIEEDKAEQAERATLGSGVGENLKPFQAGADANRAEEKGQKSPVAGSYAEETPSD
jgi:uncharacterized protein YjbJ (UPF0337 family)